MRYIVFNYLYHALIASLLFCNILILPSVNFAVKF